MKNKYIKFFKKELVFLLILLIVVCISFGMTYANFVYNSENKRAVEMFTSSLKYNLKINEVYQNSIVITPGSHIVSLEIESTNEISAYYKLLTNSNLTIYSFEGYSKGAIGSGEQLNVKLYIVNNTNKDVDVPFSISMGYLTNTLDDVIVNDGYHEIESIKNEIKYDNKKWNILRINEDASIDLVSKDNYAVTLGGYDNYNNLYNLLNSKCTTKNSKSLNVTDVNDLDILTSEDYININRLTYYPTILKQSNDIIDNKHEDENSGYNYSNNIQIRKKIINSSIENELFKNSKFLLNNSYYEVNGNEINYDVIEVNSGNINFKKLYDSNNTNYEINSNVKCIVNIKNVAF